MRKALGCSPPEMMLNHISGWLSLAVGEKTMMSDEKARSRLPPSCKINQNVIGRGRGKRTDCESVNSSDDRLLDLTNSQENHYRYIRERFVLHLFNVRAGYDTIDRPSRSLDKSSERLPAKAFSRPVRAIV